jgi:hypothetical protein
VKNRFQNVPFKSNPRRYASPSTIKFGISAGILFVLRHPAILPDEQTKAVQEAKKKAEREAVVAAEQAAAGEDDVVGRCMLNQVDP